MMYLSLGPREFCSYFSLLQNVCESVFVHMRKRKKHIYAITHLCNDNKKENISTAIMHRNF